MIFEQVGFEEIRLLSTHIDACHVSKSFLTPLGQGQ